MQTYKEHYQKSREVSNTSPVENPRYNSLYEVSVDRTFLKTDERYFDLVSRVAKKITYKFDNDIGCTTNGSKFVKYLNEWRDIEELEELTKYVMEQIEQNVFHCKLQIEFVLPYRSLSTDQKPLASWLWHYDDAPREFLKFALYLNDVTEDNGCFQYIGREKGAPILPSARLSPYQGIGKQFFPGSRVPQEAMKKLSEEGYVAQNLTGKQGTYVLFTPNIIHRATTPKPGTAPREAIFFFIRPTLQSNTKYLNENARSILPKKNVKEYKLD